jgi:hypothetical protein
METQKELTILTQEQLNEKHELANSDWINSFHNSWISYRDLAGNSTSLNNSYRTLRMEKGVLWQRKKI